jgi:hypothetical protein
MCDQPLCSDTMREPTQPSSVVGAYVAVALLAGLLVAASYPVQFAVAVMVLGGLALVGRTVWRQATTRGLTLPGAAARLRVEGAERSNGTRWGLTIAVVEDR